MIPIKSQKALYFYIAALFNTMLPDDINKELTTMKDNMDKLTDKIDKSYSAIKRASATLKKVFILVV